MDYAIVLYMDDEKTAMVNEMIKTLATECGSDFCLRVVPHITISALISNDEEAVKEEAQKLSRALKKGEVKIASIGVFNPLVLFLAPIVDDYLIESSQKANEYMLKAAEVGNQGRYIPNSWVPHMAVAMNIEKDGLYKGFVRLSEIFTPFTAKITRMSLIKWEQDNPYQELAVYDLC